MKGIRVYLFQCIPAHDRCNHNLLAEPKASLADFIFLHRHECTFSWLYSAVLSNCIKSVFQTSCSSFVASLGELLAEIPDDPDRAFLYSYRSFLFLFSILCFSMFCFLCSVSLRFVGQSTFYIGAMQVYGLSHTFKHAALFQMFEHRI